MWPTGWLACAAWAALFPLLSPLGPHRAWGAVAAVGYLVAAALSALVRQRGGQLAAAVVAFGRVRCCRSPWHSGQARARAR
ncbi:hypothetical protein KCH_61860 [Kitasatospora cheerisanensis KCTC 2395]|uniref:Uncharacterized protein n=1 Tax=Kitasatospora cheerisanensis KCTC 2395 TaxID=1348663 RepID=A0A066YLJ0_9ACTN|nr:hypothetical protein KCH_61860 [Kitasatospora cheerisanensis KCTC 2395]